MRKRLFNHPLFKRSKNRYWVTTTGKVFKSDGTELKYHLMPSGGYFVRLYAGKGKAVSMTVGKLVLLTYKPDEFKGYKIAIHKNGIVTSDLLKNLKWGIRSDQSEISMKDTAYSKRIAKMSSKHYKTTLKTKAIKALYLTHSPKRISEITGYNINTIYVHLKKLNHV